MYSRDREAICPIGLGVFVESIKGYWFVSTRQCRMEREKLYGFYSKNNNRGSTERKSNCGNA